jgi:flagellar biosynthesis protein FlhG
MSFRDGPRLVAVAGGKGGVGKSTIAANLGLALARAGRRTLLVDADLGAPNLHTMLGVFHPPRTLAEIVDGTIDNVDAIAQTCVGSTCRFVPGITRPGSANLGDDDVARIIAAIRRADAEVVVVDVGAGASYNVLDLVSACDVKLIVMTPQLTSLHNAYAMLKACVHRTVRALAAADDTEQALVDSALGSEHRARTIAQLLAVLRPLDGDIADRISSALNRFGVGLIGNQLAGPADAAMLERIGTMIRDHLAITAPVMTTVPLSPTLAGGLRSRTALDDSLPPFRRLATAVVDVDLAMLRTVPQLAEGSREWVRSAG